MKNIRWQGLLLAFSLLLCWCVYHAMEWRRVQAEEKPAMRSVTFQSGVVCVWKDGELQGCYFDDGVIGH